MHAKPAPTCGWQARQRQGRSEESARKWARPMRAPTVRWECGTDVCCQQGIADLPKRACKRPDTPRQLTPCQCCSQTSARPAIRHRSRFTMAAPVLSFPQKAGHGCPALAVIAAARLAGVQLELKPLDAKEVKDAAVTLTFPSGCAWPPHAGPPWPAQTAWGAVPPPAHRHRCQRPLAAPLPPPRPQGGAGGRAHHPAVCRPLRPVKGRRPVRLRRPVLLPGAALGYSGRGG